MTGRLVSINLLYTVIVLFEDFYTFNKHFFEHVNYSNPEGIQRQIADFSTRNGFRTPIRNSLVIEKSSHLEGSRRSGLFAAMRSPRSS